MGNSDFGARVVGHEAFDKAVREQKGGAAVFGKRVTGTIPENGPVGEAKRQTEHGHRVVALATGSDEKGKVGEGVSVESLKNILTENPTFFDSLYEAELARAGGARPEALDVLLQVETGIKGAGRKEIIDDIRELQGEKSATAAQIADRNKLAMQADAAMHARTEMNQKLADAPTVRALAQREQDIKLVEKDGDKYGGLVSESVDSQINDLAEEQGVDLSTRHARNPTEPAKPDGPIHPETQQPGPRPNVPKKVSTTKKH